MVCTEVLVSIVRSGSMHIVSAVDATGAGTIMAFHGTRLRSFSFRTSLCCPSLREKNFQAEVLSAKLIRRRANGPNQGFHTNLRFKPFPPFTSLTLLLLIISREQLCTELSVSAPGKCTVAKRGRLPKPE